jgi:ADP-ribose pyrophosphatase YjhB (NUDIX family)
MREIGRPRALHPHSPRLMAAPRPSPGRAPTARFPPRAAPPGAQPPPPPKLFTLVLIHDAAPPGRLLLGRKKRGVGEGLWNGFGGKVERGETVAAAAARELREEAFLDAPLDRRGVLTFEFDDQDVPWEVHVFYASAWSGVPTESDEMAPAWFDAASLPFGQMWADDRVWCAVWGWWRGGGAERGGARAGAGAQKTTLPPPLPPQVPDPPLRRQIRGPLFVRRLERPRALRGARRGSAA